MCVVYADVGNGAQNYSDTRCVNGWGSARDSRSHRLYARRDTQITVAEIRRIRCIRAGDCRRSHRTERQDGEKKVANQLLADGATTPGRGCNVLGLLIPR